MGKTIRRRADSTPTQRRRRIRLSVSASIFGSPTRTFTEEPAHSGVPACKVCDEGTNTEGEKQDSCLGNKGKPGTVFFVEEGDKQPRGDVHDCQEGFENNTAPRCLNCKNATIDETSRHNALRQHTCLSNRFTDISLGSIGNRSTRVSTTVIRSRSSSKLRGGERVAPEIVVARLRRTFVVHQALLGTVKQIHKAVRRAAVFFLIGIFFFIFTFQRLGLFFGELLSRISAIAVRASSLSRHNFVFDIQSNKKVFT